MAKHKFRKTTLSLDLDSLNTEDFKAFASPPDGSAFGLFPAGDGNGFTLGRDLAYGEYEGEGLPEGEGKSISFDVRVVTDKDGSMELQIASKGSGRHFRFPFKGLPDPRIPVLIDGIEKRINKPVVAFMEFFDRAERMLPMNAYYLFWACYRKQEENPSKRKESYEKIIANLQTVFASILKWDRFKAIKEERIAGGTLRTFIPIESGRRPKVETADQFKMKVFDALGRIEAEGGGKTQTDVGLIVFENEPDSDSRSQIQFALKKHGLKWHDLLAEYRETKKRKN